MSQTIEDRVVQLDFENYEFEKNAAVSLSTLDKLKSSLDFSSASKNLTALSNASSKFDLRGITNAVEEVGNKFSYMKYAGLVALGNLVDGAVDAGKRLVSALTGPIMSGGWNRAMNLEQANFMMSGIFKGDLNKVQEVMKDVNESVDGTAYSLDAAAKVAAQFAASGLKAGQNMLPALKAVAGTAAMTNSSFEEIGQIFTTVAGQGKLMTYQMRQLEFRGLNVAASLGEQLGKSEAEIRDMVTKGKIDFEMFSDAMYKAFGKHAKEANNTFSGAMANVRSALGRIGAEFATPFIKNAIPALNAFRLAINAVKETLGPVFTEASFLMEEVSGLIVSRVNGFTDFIKKNGTGIKSIFYDIIDTLKYGFNFGMQLINPIREAFQAFFPPKTINDIKKVTETILEFARNLRVSESITNTLRVAFGSLFLTFDTVISLVKQFIHVLSPLEPIIKEVGRAIMILVGYLGRAALKFNDFVKNSDVVQNVFDKMRYFILVASKNIHKLFEGLFDASLLDGSGFMGVVKKIVDGFKHIFSELIDTIKLIVPGIKNAFSSLPNLLQSIFGVIKNILGGVGNSLKTFLHSEEFKMLVDLTAKGGILYTLMNVSKGVRKGGGLSSLFNFGNVNLNFGLFNQIGLGLKSIGAALSDGNVVKIIHEAGIALLEFAGALVILSGIDEAGLHNAVTAVITMVGAITTAVGALMAVANKTSKVAYKAADKLEGLKGKLVENLEGFKNDIHGLIEGTNMAATLGTAAVLISQLADAILKLSIAVKILSTIDFKGIAKGLFAITVMMAELVGSVAIISSLNFSETFNAGVFRGFMKMADALLVISLALKITSTLDTDQVLHSVTALTVIFGEMIGMMAVIKNADQYVARAGRSILWMSTGMLILMEALTRMTNNADFSHMAASIAGISTCVVLIIGMLALFAQKNNGIDSFKMRKTAQAMSIMSGGILLLGQAISIAAESVNWKNFIPTILAMEAVMLEIAGLMMISKYVSLTDVFTMGLAFTMLAGAFLTISQGVRLLARTMTGDNLVPTLSTMVAILVSLMAPLISLATVADEFKRINSLSFAIIGLALIEMSSAFLVMAKAISVIASSVNKDNIVPVLEAMAGIIVAMVVPLVMISLVCSKLNNIEWHLLMGAAVILGLIGLSILEVAAAIRLIATIPVDKFTATLKTFTVSMIEMQGVLVILTLACKELGMLNMLAAAGALTTVTTSLLAVSGAFVMLGMLPTDKIKAATIALDSFVGIVAILMTVLAALSTTGMGAIGTAVASGALFVFAESILLIGSACKTAAAGLVIVVKAMEQFTKLNVEKLATNWKVLADALKSTFWRLMRYSIVASVLSPAISTFTSLMALLGFALIPLGEGLNLCSKAFLHMAEAMHIIVDIGPAVNEGLVGLSKAIVASARALGIGLTTALRDSLVFLASFTPEIREAILTIAHDLLPVIVQAFMILGAEVTRSIAVFAPQIVENVTVIFVAIAQVLAKYTVPLGEAACDLIVGVMAVARTKMEEVSEAFILLVLEFLDNLANKMAEHHTEMVAACDKLAITMIVTLMDWTKHFNEVGKDWINGLVSGIKDVGLGQGGKVVKAAWAIGRASIDKLREAIDSNSPSKETGAEGRNYVDGYVNEILAGVPNAEGAGYSLGSGSLSGLESGLSGGFTSVAGLLDTAYDHAANAGSKVEQLTGEVASWVTGKMAMVDSGLYQSTRYVVDNKSTWDQWGQNVHKQTERLRYLTDEQNRLKTEFSAGRMSVEEYRAATGNLESEIESIIPDIQRLQALLAQAKYAEIEVTGEQKKLSAALRDGKISHQDYDREMARTNNILNDYNYLLEYGKKKQEEANVATEEGTEKVTEYGDATKGAGGKAKEAADDISKFGESLEKTLEGQLNLFDEYKKDDPMNPDQLIKNMEDQINGMTSWAANMTKLSEAGIDKGLYQKLAEMGPQGAKYVDAFASMTAEQLQHANELFATSIQLPSTVSAGIIKDYDNLGKNIVQGEINGINAQTGNLVDAQQSAQEETYTEGAAKPNEVQSPSRLYWRLGMYLMYGLQEGIRDHKQQVLNTMRFFCDELYAVAKTNLDSSKFKEIGSMVSEGLAEGLEANLDRVRSASKALSKIPGSTFTKENDIESPSKLFYSFGRYIDMGLANGIHDYGGLVSDSMEETSNHMVNTMRDTVSRIAQEIQDGVDDPVITPILDLSNVQNGARRLGAMFSTSQAYATAESLGGLQNGKFVGGTTFIQNNYSPKALTRADIYRQTRNQFAQYRQATL